MYESRKGQTKDERRFCGIYEKENESSWYHLI